MFKMVPLIIVVCCFCNNSMAQNEAGKKLAAQMAKKMKDSLNLTNQQENAILQINLQLNTKKYLVRQQYAASDSLRRFLQKTENSRDSLYKKVLPAQSYNLYLIKKKNMLNINWRLL